MQLFIDFLPILAFFIAFKLFGIYIATAAAIVISILQVGMHWVKHRNVSILQIISLALIAILGGGTLMLHNELLIKWKPTALYWLLALLFLGSQLFSEKTFIQRLMETNINLPQAVWNRLNLGWVSFFTLMGCANLYVIYHFNTNTWVNFKLFGLLGLTFIFVIAQAVYLARYLKDITINDKQ